MPAPTPPSPTRAPSRTGRCPLGLKLKHKLFDVLLYSKIRAAMGGNVVHAVSGGAPLGERLGHFFHGIGLTVLEGYGLTETTAPITVNTPSQLKIGTVGRPLPGNAVKIAADGEILAKGFCVMRGYYNRPDLTDETFADGWFRTGDIGELDADGFLRITGRKKEIIVTASGKNVIPGAARGPDPRRRAGVPVRGGGRRPPVHRRTGHPGCGGASGLAGTPPAAGRHHPGPGGGAPGRSATRLPHWWRRPTPRSPGPRQSRSSASCPPTSPRTRGT